ERGGWAGGAEDGGVEWGEVGRAGGRATADTGNVGSHGQGGGCTVREGKRQRASLEGTEAGKVALAQRDLKTHRLALGDGLRRADRGRFVTAEGRDDHADRRVVAARRIDMPPCGSCERSRK